MNENKNFKPYVSADKVLPEFTVTSIIMGIILAIVFGAANAYLGLKVGMTVSASIPAAVISMGVIRVIMRRNSILESNMVQTIGSAGESLAPEPSSQCRHCSCGQQMELWNLCLHIWRSQSSRFAEVSSA